MFSQVLHKTPYLNFLNFEPKVASAQGREMASDIKMQAFSTIFSTILYFTILAKLSLHQQGLSKNKFFGGVNFFLFEF